MGRLILAATALALVGCQSSDQQQSARTALNAFCRAHQADIFATLLTDQQRQAATLVCQAIGLPLGT